MKIQWNKAIKNILLQRLCCTTHSINGKQTEPCVEQREPSRLQLHALGKFIASAWSSAVCIDRRKATCELGAETVLFL